MNIKSVLVPVVTIVVGVLGATVAYQAALPTNGAAPTAERPVAGPGRDLAQDRAKFAPCRAPARPKGGRCVTEVVREVVVPGSVVPAAWSAGSSAAVPMAPSSGSSPRRLAPTDLLAGDDGDHDDGEHRGDDRDDERDDD